MSDSDHNCIEVLLTECILIQVKAGDRAYDPIAYKFKNITNETSRPRTQYILVLDDDDLEDIKEKL